MWSCVDGLYGLLWINQWGISNPASGNIGDELSNGGRKTKSGEIWENWLKLGKNWEKFDRRLGKIWKKFAEILKDTCYLIWFCAILLSSPTAADSLLYTHHIKKVLASKSNHSWSKQHVLLAGTPLSNRKIRNVSFQQFQQETMSPLQEMGEESLTPNSLVPIILRKRRRMAPGGRLCLFDNAS